MYNKTLNVYLMFIYTFIFIASIFEYLCKYLLTTSELGGIGGYISPPKKDREGVKNQAKWGGVERKKEEGVKI